MPLFSINTSQQAKLKAMFLSELTPILGSIIFRIPNWCDFRWKEEVDDIGRQNQNIAKQHLRILSNDKCYNIQNECWSIYSKLGFRSQVCVVFKTGPLTMSNSDVGYFVSNPENRWNAKVYQMKYWGFWWTAKFLRNSPPRLLLGNYHEAPRALISFISFSCADL